VADVIPLANCSTRHGDGPLPFSAARQALGVIASLVFLGLEIQQNTAVARAPTRQAEELNRLVATN